MADFDSSRAALERVFNALIDIFYFRLNHPSGARFYELEGRGKYAEGMRSNGEFISR
jgi:hypothetical protein